VGHEDDSFGAIVNGVLDCGKGADDALVIRDFVAVKGNIEVDLRKPLARHSMIVNCVVRRRRKI